MIEDKSSGQTAAALIDKINANTDKQELTAPCGMDCFNCDLYSRNLTDSLRRKFALLREIPLEQVACLGCRAEHARGQNCRYMPHDCVTWHCAQRQQVRYCYQCADFPCRHYAPSAPGAGYPHNLKLYNLCRIQSIGHERWAEEAAANRQAYYRGDFIVGAGPCFAAAEDEE